MRVLPAAATLFSLTFLNLSSALAAPPFQANAATIAAALQGNAAAIALVQQDLDGANPTAFLNNIAARLATLATISTADNNNDGILDALQGGARAGTLTTINNLSTQDANGNGTPDILETDSNGDGIPDAAIIAANYMTQTANSNLLSMNTVQQVIGGGALPASVIQNQLINTAIVGENIAGLVTLTRAVAGDVTARNTLNQIFPGGGLNTFLNNLVGRIAGGDYNRAEQILGYAVQSSGPRDINGDGVPETPYIYDRSNVFTALTQIMSTYGATTAQFGFLNALSSSIQPPSLLDTDGDGIPDVNDTDDDNDGIPDITDPNPLVADDSTDTDGDGVPDIIDQDVDGDGCNDDDYDCDGIPDATDTDDDNDGIPDTSDTTLNPQPPRNTPGGGTSLPPPATPPVSTQGSGTTTGSGGGISATGTNGSPTSCGSESADLTDNFAVDPCAWTRDNNNLSFAQNYFGGEQVMLYLEDWWVNDYLPSLKNMTAQIHAGILDQSRQMGSLNDHLSQAKKARTIQNLADQNKTDIKPGEQQTCAVGSTGPALTQTFKTAHAIAQGLKNDLTNNAQGAPGTPGEFGIAPVIAQRFETYCEYFLDPEANQGNNACPNPTTAGALIDGDVDIEGLLLRDTIDMDKPEELAAAQALLANLVQPDVYGRLSDEEAETSGGKQYILKKERLESIRRVASETIATIISRRAAIPLPTSVSAGATVPPAVAPAAPAATPTPPGAIPSKGSYDDLLNAIGQRESGSVSACSNGSVVGYGGAGSGYSCVNTIGYLGKYQFGYPALVDLGCVKLNGTGSGNAGKLGNPANWTGACGNNASEFLANGAQQETLIRRYMQLQWQYAAPSQSAACNTVNGVAFSPAGILAGAHLVGAGAVNKFVRTGQNQCDAYGTCVTSYVDEFGGYDTPFMDQACNPGTTTAGAFTPYTPPPARPVSEIIREIRERAGIPADQIAENPSYNEIMLALTKEHFFDPAYFVNMGDNIGAMQYEEQAMDALVSMSLQDIYVLQEQINTLITARAGLEIEASTTSDATSDTDKQ